MNFTQQRLKKHEWEAIEIPLLPNDKFILKMIMNGYTDTAITNNKNMSLIGFMKISNEEKYHKHLFTIYFESLIKSINKKLTKGGFDAINISFKKEKVQLKKADMIRIENTDKQIKMNEEIIYEYVLLNCCKRYLKAMKSIYYYTIVRLLQNNITNLNKYVIEYINRFLSCFNVDKIELIQNASEYIEENTGLQAYEDIKLYSHQKELFDFCREKRSVPKLVFYQAPTGTGKTMSPLALTKDYCVLFVCAAKHIGLQLARACISMEIPIGVAFGCNDASGVRLHYYAAKDYIKNKFTGGIFKVDHTVGDKAKLIVCDIKSYLPAMYYMLAFHKAEDILFYWDEPTISLDYEQHEIHDIIQENWSKNEIPNIILSSATLPSTELLPNCTMSFKFNHTNGIIHNINSYDCKKTITLLSPDGNIIMPHSYYATSESLLNCIEHIKQCKTILRHLNVNEITKYILSIQSSLPKEMTIEKHFIEMTNITITSIKLYYLKCLEFMATEYKDDWRPMKKECMFKSSIYITTQDAYTLTGGPTIFLTDNIKKIGNFYLQQAKIPEQELERLNKTMTYNDKLTQTIDKLTKQMNLDEDKEELTPEQKAKMRQIKEIETKKQEMTLSKIYVPNTREHVYRFHKDFIDNIFTSSLTEYDIEQVVLLHISNNIKLLLLMGIGVFDESLSMEYLEVMKKMAYEQKLYLIIASSDYIYGTNYQFCHGYLSKDLLTMTQEKIIQCLGRVGRGNKQQNYTIRLRSNDFIQKLFEEETNKIEATNMNRLFTDI